jgi:hypothetical protein
VLYRLRERGDISDEEWEKRRREPMHVCGPLNIRPFLDNDWFENGGAGELCLSIGFFYYTLPFMPFGTAVEDAVPLNNGAPPFSALLSSERFFLRSNIIRKQAEAFLKHPLFLDINAARLPAKIELSKIAFDQWRDTQNATAEGKNLDVLSDGGSYLTPDLIFAHGGSSMGNVNLVFIFLSASRLADYLNH